MAAAVVTQAGMRLVRLLVGNPPQTMGELIEGAGVTRTAVTEQLQELLTAGFVSRTTQPGKRGRPRHLYSATEEAMKLLFVNNQRLLAPMILRAIFDLAGHELAQQVLDRVTQELADLYHSRVAGQSPAERFRRFADLLSVEGVLLEFQDDGHSLRIRERTCPFVDMVDNSRSVCAVERAMISLVVGAPVQLTACRLDGCAGCTFELADGAPA